MAPSRIHGALTKNRAEELGHDVSQNFVVPPFFDRLDLQDARKPRVIVGGRGCGKTMLLRYLSHDSAFSQTRMSVPADALSHIGLYWRADTQFTSLMTRRGLDDDRWHAAFEHFLAVVLAVEVLRSVRSVALSACDVLDARDVDNLVLGSVGTYFGRPTVALRDLAAILESSLEGLELWVSNVGKVAEPVFLPGVRFLSRLIADIHAAHDGLKAALFFVYVDEYENLQPYQQKVINTYLKHSELPLIFNVAIKRYGFPTRLTLSGESITNIADYREHDIESYLDDDFGLFAAEVLGLNLALAGSSAIPVSPQLLREPDAIGQRRAPRYRTAILAAAHQLFPTVSPDEIARGVLSDRALRKTLHARIEQALKARGSDLSPDIFVDDAVPSASVTCMALVNRRSVSLKGIQEHLSLHLQGQPNNFTGPTAWIHNNLFGCILALYAPFSRPCPLYAGFDAFTKLARGNMRHFLELCHKSLSSDSSIGDRLVVAPILQAEAARRTSADFLGEVKSLGRYGHRLHSFVLALGSLFALAHSRPTQSEPEQAHFSIAGGTIQLSESDQAFLQEAVKWSVLFEERETKLKSSSSVTSFEYVLNPIYAPYFHVTYRKRRKLELKTDDVAVLVHGRYDEVRTLLARFRSQWRVDAETSSEPLFSLLD